MGRLTLYGRERCHLCEEMHEDIQVWLRRAGALDQVRLDEVDVDSRPELIAAYGARVPVLVDAGGQEICDVRFDADAFCAWWEAAGHRSL